MVPFRTNRCCRLVHRHTGERQSDAEYSICRRKQTIVTLNTLQLCNYCQFPAIITGRRFTLGVLSISDMSRVRQINTHEHFTANRSLSVI
jgi:hypothetical protein